MRWRPSGEVAECDRVFALCDHGRWTMDDRQRVDWLVSCSRIN